MKCNIKTDKTNSSSRPDANSFRKYISYFVMDVPDETCAKGGRAAYFDVSQILLETIAVFVRYTHTHTDTFFFITINHLIEF